MTAPPPVSDPEQSPEAILAAAINRNTDEGVAKLKRVFTRNAIIAATVVVLAVGTVFAVQQRTITRQGEQLQQQSELLGRRSTTVNFLGCFTDFLLGVFDAERPPTDEQQVYIDATRKGLDRARNADLEQGQNIPACVPPPKPGG